jgi:hypothetical protein
MNSCSFEEGTGPIYGILSSTSIAVLLVTHPDRVPASQDLKNEKSVIEATFFDNGLSVIFHPFAINIHFYSAQFV